MTQDTIGINHSKEHLKAKALNLITKDVEYRNWIIDIVCASGYEEIALRAVYEGIPESKYAIGEELTLARYDKEPIKVTMVSFDDTEKWSQYAVKQDGNDELIRCSDYELKPLVEDNE